MSDSNSMTEPSTAAREAAGWWSEAVRAPRYDNGDDTGISGLLMTLTAAQKPNATADQRASFADILAARFQSELDKFASWGREYYNICVGVDYGPEKLLAEAARDAGISTSKFPWKTMMWIYPDYVTVSAGYGAETRLVWASDEWLADRPKCGRQQWDEAKSRDDFANYHGEPFRCSAPMYHDDGHVYDERIALCGDCGRPEGWYHNREERGHMSDFHQFAAKVQA